MGCPLSGGLFGVRIRRCEAVKNTFVQPTTSGSTPLVYVCNNEKQVFFFYVRFSVGGRWKLAGAVIRHTSARKSADTRVDSPPVRTCVSLPTTKQEHG